MKYVLLFAAGFIIGILLNRSTPGEVQKVTVTEFRDTVIYKIKKVPKLITQVQIETDTIYIDTNKVIKDYFVHRFYSDTIVNDTNLTAVVSSQCFRNEIIYTDLNYRINRPTRTITKTVQAPDRFKVGAMVTGGARWDVHALGYYKGVTVGISPFSKTVSVGYVKNITF
jgi:hypothetical protein